MKKITLALSLTLFALTTSLFSQNVGIGDPTPQYKLDVAGRLRLQHAGATAGIFFDGTSAPTRSFIGTIDNDHVGIFGAVTGWKFAFNVVNGNVGIGLSNPTSTLDVNGGFRLRDVNPIVKGSTLISSDALGNVDWQSPVAFKVLGYSYGPNILFPHNTWTDINFGTNISYNFGSGYNSANSEFVAPRKGIYHFISQLNFTTATDYCAQRLMLRRNGATSVQSISEHNCGYEQTMFSYTSILDTEISLEAGDAIRIEGISTDPFGTDTRYIYGNALNTWWCGRLVQPL